jgi:radical SAM protein with 4Fe4S-binding SPASM domain
MTDPAAEALPTAPAPDVSPFASPRMIRPGDLNTPIYAVWELTMACDHACAHCGSRAARARPDELSTDEALGVARGLIDLGCREVTLIGGEAYLRADVYALTELFASNGVRVGMQTGGRGLTLDIARRLRDAGMRAVGVSVDGPEAVHDTLRASRGSHRAAMAALDAGREVGFALTSNTQVNRLNAHLLRETLAPLAARDVRAWRCQLTVPMGRAADHPEWILEPWRMLDVIDELAAIQLEIAEDAARRGLPPRRMLSVQLGNNLGYYGPHEVVLRSRPGGAATWWQGCNAGKYTIGIESDGKVKACPSLPTAPYVGGNVRDQTLRALWSETPELAFARTRTTDELWGFCATCEYNETCMAGCSFTAHSTLGRRGNNPFCYHRAATLKGRGRRERLVQVEAAPGLAYDFGRFEIVEEDWVEAG